MKRWILALVCLAILVPAYMLTRQPDRAPLTPYQAITDIRQHASSRELATADGGQIADLMARVCQSLNAGHSVSDAIATFPSDQRADARLLGNMAIRSLCPRFIGQVR